MQKKPKQTWEDLAYEVKNLTTKGYKDINESTQERLAAQAFVNAIPEDKVRNKVCDQHPRTVMQALQQVRQAEADLTIEQQRTNQMGKKEGAKETIKTIRNEETEEKIRVLEQQVKTLQTKVEEKSTEKDKKKEVETPRGDTRGRSSWNRG